MLHRLSLNWNSSGDEENVTRGSASILTGAYSRWWTYNSTMVQECTRIAELVARARTQDLHLWSLGVLKPIYPEVEKLRFARCTQHYLLTTASSGMLQHQAWRNPGRYQRDEQWFNQELSRKTQFLDPRGYCTARPCGWCKAMSTLRNSSSTFSH